MAEGTIMSFSGRQLSTDLTGCVNEVLISARVLLSELRLKAEVWLTIPRAGSSDVLGGEQVAFLLNRG